MSCASIASMTSGSVMGTANAGPSVRGLDAPQGSMADYRIRSTTVEQVFYPHRNHFGVDETGL